ncbi:hypothetical protein QCA50_008425 [Cerrena zonata]|uniref:LysM domain-containing protein n=1 Tax=Cerrena zonata TaxID=2478898 RepID=A0AAW0GAA8_9APHY
MIRLAMFPRIQFASLVALVIGTTTVYAQTLPPNCARTYTVQPGDTCNGICVQQSVSTFQLTNANSVIDAACDNLFVGEIVCLAIAGQDCQPVHVVRGGDNCFIIAQGAGISQSVLIANNPNINPSCNNLAIGEVVCVASKVVPH